MLPTDASADGHRVDALLHTLHGLTAAVALAVVALLAWAWWRGRSRADDREDDGFTPGHGAGVGLLALCVMGMIDLMVLRRSSRDMSALGSPPRGEGVVRVEVLARQFSWEFRLAGDDGVFGTDDDLTSTDGLSVPVGRPVVFQVRSVDVVHGMSVPAMRVKVDAIPGRTTTAWFRARRPGTQELMCSQLCGPSHHQMRAEVRVLGERAWEAETAARSADQRRLRAAGARAPGWGWAWEE